MEPTHQRWLYALETPQPLDNKSELTWEYRLLARDAVHDKFSYRARADKRRSMDLDLDTRLRLRTLKIPADSNPRTQQWAFELRERVRMTVNSSTRCWRIFDSNNFSTRCNHRCWDRSRWTNSCSTCAADFVNTTPAVLCSRCVLPACPRGSWWVIRAANAIR
jgi:hypothetical protein